MLVDYRCGDCGSVEERIVPRGPAAPRACSDCGGVATRVFSTFQHRQWAFDRSNFAAIAPLTEDGRPMTLKEASKVGDRYTPGEADRERRRMKTDDAAQDAVALKDARERAWQEVSRRRRIKVGS